MFSPLARGVASWEGDVECEDYFDQKFPIAPLLPQSINQTYFRSKSAKSSSSYVLDDGQLFLPRTFVTRKGAILLFTPSDDLCNHGNGDSHLKKQDVYEAGLKLRTLGNLTNSVLEFGKEDKEACEGIPDSQKQTQKKENQQKGNRKSFLRFLHYLDSDNLTADKHVQPGANPEYYLEELKKSSGHNAYRRFRSLSQSIKMSHGSNTYSQFLDDDDDDEITSIIEDYMKYNKPECSQDKQHLDHGVVSTDHIPERCEPSDDFSYFSFPKSSGTSLNNATLSPSMPSMSSSSFQGSEDWISRPKTAPIPPTLESPRANPRITSAKPPPSLRALGSTPNHLDEIINADVGLGRHHRRKLSRSPSPSFHVGSSRGVTSEYTRFERLASPEIKNDEWNRASHVIEEEDEVSLPGNRVGSGKGSVRPASAGPLQCEKDEKMRVQRRPSSGGRANRESRTSPRSSRSASLSSVSNINNRTLSALSKDQELLNTFWPYFEDSVHDDNLPTLPIISPDLSRLQDNLVVNIADSRTASPSHDSLPCTSPDRDVSPSRDSTKSLSRDKVTSASRESHVQSPSPPAGSPSVSSRIASPYNRSLSGHSPGTRTSIPSATPRIDSSSTRSQSAQSCDDKEGRSRISSAAASLETNFQLEEVLKAADVHDERSDSISSHERAVASRQSELTLEENNFERDTRTSSAKSARRDPGTESTLGSEDAFNKISGWDGGSQLLVEGMLDEEEKLHQEWTGVNVDGNESESGDVNQRHANDGNVQELDAMSSVHPPGDEFPHRPSVNSTDGLSLHSTKPGSSLKTTETDEKQREASVIEPVNGTKTDLGSAINSTEPLENEATAVEAEETEVFTLEGGRLANVTDEDSHSVMDSVTDENDGPLTDVACASSPAPIKADQILHKELLTETGSEVEGPVRDGRPLSPYKELIDIEKSRPSTPVTEEQRNIPVDVGESVRAYIASGKQPQIRERSARSRQGSETGNEEREIENTSNVTEEASASEMELTESIISLTTEVADAPINKESKLQLSSLSEKRKGLAGGKDEKRKSDLKPEVPRLSVMKDVDKGKNVKEPTDEEREARRKMVTSLLSKQEAPPKRGKLELEGIGKEGEDAESASQGLVTRARPVADEQKKNDLSDLVAMAARNKGPSKPQEKKPELKKKSGKRSNSAKKENKIDPKNIDFEAFNTPEMLEGMDDELRQFIQEQSKSDVTSAPEEPAGALVDHKQVKRRESGHTLEIPQVAKKVPPEQKDAHAPSKPKKPSKKEQAKVRADQRRQERKRKEEEKKLKEEEMRLLKEREEEAAKAKAESEEKQRNVEEEKLKRLAEEEEARKQEQEALEKLKEAKKRAREERESRRAAEAERRRIEVQKKREEKKKREEELKEREKELEQRRMDQERRMAEIEEARRRKEELERVEEEQRNEEERLLALQEEEEERTLEEAKIREAEEELRRIQEEREYREQMRKIAEMQEAKLRQEEEERLRREEEERQRMEEEKRKREEEEQKRIREEQRRIEMARRLEALARMRSAEVAARRKALLLKRREINVERLQNLKNSRCGQSISRAFVFTYYLNIPRKVWEVPIGYNKKKRGYGAPRRKMAPPKPP